MISFQKWIFINALKGIQRKSFPFNPDLPDLRYTYFAMCRYLIAE